VQPSGVVDLLDKPRQPLGHVEKALVTGQLAGHPSILVAGQFVLNILNETDEFRV
jgi:hypothetical protein